MAVAAAFVNCRVLLSFHDHTAKEMAQLDETISFTFQKLAAKVWNALAVFVFLAMYYLDAFKRRVNRQYLGERALPDLVIAPHQA